MDFYAINTISYPYHSQSPTLTMDPFYDIRTPQLADFERLGETLASEGDIFLPSPRTNAEYWGPNSQAQSSSLVASPNSWHAAPSSVSPMNNLAIKPRAKVILPEEWERRKPIIESLYIDRGLTLPLVRETMATDHGFFATEMMYKKRFSSWKWRKYYSKDQKEEALRRLAEARKAEDIIINKKPLNAERLRRPIQRNGHQIRLNQRHLQRQDIISRCQFQQSPEVYRVESILRHARRFLLSRTDVFPSPDWVLRSQEMQHLKYLFLARNFLRSSDQRAFPILNTAASVVRDVLANPSFGLLHNLLFEFTNQDWGTFPEIKFHMLQYFVSMAQCTLGPKHPISELVAYLVDERDSKELVSRFGRLCIDTVDDVVVHLDYDAAQATKIDIIAFLQSTGLYVESHTVTQQLIQKANEHPSLINNQIKVAAILYQAKAKFIRDDVVAAEKLCLQVLQAIESGTEDHLWLRESQMHLHLYSVLATIYQVLGDQEKRLACLRMAIQEKSGLCGVKDPDVLENVRDLEKCLEEHGQLEELNQLRVTWKPVWDELENELKG